MNFNRFIWTDLSTYFPSESIDFYKSVFNWHFQDYANYHLASIDDQFIVGIYETPEFFKKINMPHFWMNYINVADLKATTDLAVKLGGKVELNNEEFYGGKIALIRDPMGAGFTVYEGNMLKQSNLENESNVAGRELHVSNINEVLPFYQSLFDWEITKDEYGGSYVVRTKDSHSVCTFLELNNEIKGKFEYWITIFGVSNLKTTLGNIIESGGTVISDEGKRILCTDKFGEAFFYVEENGAS